MYGIQFTCVARRRRPVHRPPLSSFRRNPREIRISRFTLPSI